MTAAKTASRASTNRKPPTKRAAAKPKPAKATTDTITVSTKEFEKAIGRIKLFAGTDPTLPMINGIALQLQDGILTLAATDRFVLGANILVPLFDDDLPEGRVLPSDFTVLIRLAELPLVLAALKRSERFMDRVELQVLDREVVIDGVTIGDASFSGNFPDWRKIVEQAERTANGVPEFNEIALNPVYLRRFTQIKPVPEFRVAGPMRPVIATSDGFVGVLMPVRIVKERSEVLGAFGISAAASPTAVAS